MSAPENGEIEETRRVLLRHKKAYKVLAADHLDLQVEVAQLEKDLANKATLKDLAKRAQAFEKNAVKLQAVIRGRFWRRKIAQMRARMLEGYGHNRTISAQEKYLKAVQQTDSYEFLDHISQFQEAIQNKTGLNFMMIFRALDVKSQGSILTDDLFRYMNRVSTNQTSSDGKSSKGISQIAILSPESIKKTISCFDKKDCGYISFEKMKDIVTQANKMTQSKRTVSSKQEKSYLVQEYEGSMARIAEQIEQEEITPNELFSRLSVKNANFMHKDRFFEWTASSDCLSPDEKLAFSSVFNLQQTLFIKRGEFLNRLSPFIRKLEKSQSNIGQAQNQQPFQVAGGSVNNISMLSANSSKLSDSKLSLISLTKTASMKSKFNPENETEIVQAILDKMFKQKPIHLFIEQILLMYSAQRTYLTTEDLLSAFETFAGSDVVTNKEKGLVFRTMDSDGNGQLEMSELVQFFVRFSKKATITLQSFLIMQAKILEIEGTSTKDFFSDLNLDSELVESIDIATFHNTFGTAIGLDESSTNQLFLQIDKHGSGSISIFELEALIDGYRSDSKQSKGNNATGQTEVDPKVAEKLKLLQEFETQLSVQAKLSIPQLWEQADITQQGYVSLYELKNTIARVLPKMKSNQIVRMLSYIDINENGIIDNEEYSLAFLSGQKKSKVRSKMNSPAISLNSTKMRNASNAEIIQKLKAAIHKKGLSLIDFFSLADTDKSGGICMAELREVLSKTLQMDLSVLLKVMQALDVNGDGQIEFQEFFEALGSEIPVNTKSSSFNVKDQAKISGVIKLKDTDKQIDDHRSHSDVLSRIDDYGPEEPNELKMALITFGSFITSKAQKAGATTSNQQHQVYEKIFADFDTDKDQTLTRGEFIAGLDKLASQLSLTERQKIRLSITADKNRDDKIDMKEFIDFIKQTNLQIAIKAADEEKARKIASFKGNAKNVTEAAIAAVNATPSFFVDQTAERSYQRNKMIDFLCEQIRNIKLEQLIETGQKINPQLQQQQGDKGILMKKITEIFQLAERESIFSDSKLQENKDVIVSIQDLNEVFITNIESLNVSEDDIEQILGIFEEKFDGFVRKREIQEENNELSSSSLHDNNQSSS